MSKDKNTIDLTYIIMLRYGLTLLITALLGTCALAQSNLVTLEMLQKEAAQQATDVLIAQQNLRSASLQADAFQSALKPRLDLVANFPNYFRTSTEVIQEDGTVAFREIELNNSFVGLAASQQIAATGGTITLESRLQRTDNLALDMKSYNGAPIRLSFLQPILAFNPLKWNRELLPLRQLVSERALEAARAEAALAATDRFFDLVAADQERRIAETNKTANERLYSIAEERFELGKINRGDLVQLRLELASAEQNLRRSERLVAAASAAIFQLLGKTYANELLEPALPEGAVERTITADRALRLLKDRRPELLRARLANREAARDADQIKRDLGPRIDLEARFGLVRNDLNLAPIYSDPRSERILSVNLSMPILDWGERRSLTKRAKGEQALAEEIGRRTEMNLTSELLQLLDQWAIVQEELALATEIKDLADERFRISQESYTLGSIPLTELTLAQNNRDQNTRAYASTLRAYWLTYARLARLTLWDFINNQPLGEE
jgi:outer membrane protein